MDAHIADAQTVARAAAAGKKQQAATEVDLHLRCAIKATQRNCMHMHFSLNRLICHLKSLRTARHET